MNRCMLCWQAALLLQILCCSTHGGILKCSGEVRIEPAPVFLMGSNVSIICISALDCYPGTLHLYLNSDEVKSGNDYPTILQLQLHDVRASYNVYCSITCAGKPKNTLVCGNSMSAGYPPETPSNLMCFLYERSYTMMCTWDTGKYTHINTKYTANLTSSQAQQEFIFHASSSFTIAMNKSHEDTEYSLVVRAANDLGEAATTALRIHLNDIVIPAPPVFMKAEFLNSSSPGIVVQWKNQPTFKKLYGEMRFKCASNRTWTLVKAIIWESNMEKRLQVEQTFEPDTTYEFQIRCRYINDTKYWSTWSESFNKTTPEAEPSNAPETWRSFDSIFTNGSSKEVTVLIKPLDPKSKRGRILGYKVFYEDQGEERLLNICKTWELRCRTLVPKGVDAILVTAYNSKGHSKPAKVIIHQEENKCLDCPPPKNMQIVSTHQNAVLVTWDAPEGAATLWYVIEWIPIVCYRPQQYLQWKRVSVKTSSIHIQENLMAGVRVNISLYAVCMQAVSTPCVGYAFPLELKPEMGPTVLLPKKDGEKVLLEWEQIPACKQRGLIVKYTIYLRNDSENSETQYIVHPSRYSRWFDKLNPDTFYTAHVTASTIAGEGPAGKTVGFKLDVINNNVEIWLSTVFAAIILTLLILILMSRKKIRASVKNVLISWLPIWLQENVPKAENSKAIKTLQTKDGVISTSSLLLPIYSEPLITQIKDTSQEEELQLPENQSKINEVLEPCPGLGLQDAKFMEGSGSHIPSPANGYKPQISTGSGSESAPLALSRNNSEGDGNDLISDTSQFFNAFEDAYDVCTWSANINSSDVESGSFWPFACVNNTESTEYERESLLLGGTRQEGILPGAPLWQLTTMHGGCLKAKSYFPQTFEK